MDSATKGVRVSVALQAFGLAASSVTALGGPNPALDGWRLACSWLAILVAAIVWPSMDRPAGRAYRWLLGAALALHAAVHLTLVLPYSRPFSAATIGDPRLAPLVASVAASATLAALLFQYDTLLSLRRRVHMSWIARGAVAIAIGAGLALDPPWLAAAHVAIVGLWLVARTPATARVTASWLVGVALWKWGSGSNGLEEVLAAAGIGALVLGAQRLIIPQRLDAERPRRPGAARTALGGANWLFAMFGFATAIMLSARLGFLAGAVRPIRVSGASMLPHWMSEHWESVCPTCGFPFRIDTRSSRLVTPCPNCHAMRETGRSNVPRVGDRLMIDGWPFQDVHRWQVVALQGRSNGTFRELKRVVGLPGERLGIVGGDIYIDGTIRSKTLAELRASAVLVHDDRFEPRQGAPPRVAPRWISQVDPTYPDRRWHVFPLSPRQPTSIGPDTIGPDTIGQDTMNGPKEDRLANVPGEDPSTDIVIGPMTTQPLRDLLLVCEMRVVGSGRIWWRYNGAAGPFDLEISFPDGTWSLRNGEHQLAERKMSAHLPRKGEWEFAVYDERLTLAINGRRHVDFPMPRRPRSRDATNSGKMSQLLTAHHLAVGSTGVELTPIHRQVFRDLYYVGPNGTNAPWFFEQRLSDQQVFVLGDHPQGSMDSRQNGPRSIRDLLGTAVRRGAFPQSSL